MFTNVYNVYMYTNTVYIYMHTCTIYIYILFCVKILKLKNYISLIASIQKPLYFIKACCLYFYCFYFTGN